MVMSPFEDVQQLGQLVDTDLADEPAHWGDPVILVAGGEPGDAVLLRVHPHAAELENLEQSCRPWSGRVLFVEHRAAVVGA